MAIDKMTRQKIIAWKERGRRLALTLDVVGVRSHILAMIDGFVEEGIDLAWTMNGVSPEDMKYPFGEKVAGAHDDGPQDAGWSPKAQIGIDWGIPGSDRSVEVVLEGTPGVPGHKILEVK